MNREDCENKIFEKLKEVSAIFREYNESEKYHLILSISNDSNYNHMSIFNSHTDNKRIDVALINEEVCHFGN